MKEIEIFELMKVIYRSSGILCVLFATIMIFVYKKFKKNITKTIVFLSLILILMGIFFIIFGPILIDIVIDYKY